MSKLKNFKGFADKFTELLNLTQSQVDEIEKAEYSFYKDHYWNNLPKDIEHKKAYEKAIYSYLDSDQISLLNKYKEEQKAKQVKKNEEKFKKSLEIQNIRLKELDLTPEQIETYVKRKLNFTKLRLQKMKLAKTKKELDLNCLQRRIYEEEIYPIFNGQQLTLYKEIIIEEKIKNEEAGKKWRSNHNKLLFKERYNIELTNKQAKEIFAKDFNSPLKDSKGEFYSDFEMKEKELHWFKQNLTEEQLEIYLPFYNQQYDYLIDSIKKSNSNHHKTQLERLKAYLNYYAENVLPHLIDSRKRIEINLTQVEKELINHIRKYYFEQQAKQKDKYIKQHYRHYKEYNPNELNQFIIRQEIEKINFNICYLYGNKQAKKLMSNNLIESIELEYKNLNKIYSSLKEFQITNYESTGGNYGTPVMKISVRKGEEYLNRIGILLLLPELSSNLELLKMR